MEGKMENGIVEEEEELDPLLSGLFLVITIYDGDEEEGPHKNVMELPHVV